MGYNSKITDSCAVVTIDEPRLDASKAESFRQYIEDLINTDVTDLIIDLSPVTFMDSSGLGAVVAVFKRLKDTGTVTLAGPQNAVKELFNLTCMDKIFTIYDTVIEAQNMTKMG